jgi:hypothetical protein
MSADLRTWWKLIASSTDGYDPVSIEDEQYEWTIG